MSRSGAGGRHAAPNPALGILRLTLLVCISGCTTLFDSPAFEASGVMMPDEMLQEARRNWPETVQHELDSESTARPGRLGTDSKSDVAVSRPPTAHALWPIIDVTRIGGTTAQVVIASPVRGMVVIDEQEIGPVQEGSVRVVTVLPGDHVLRIEVPDSPPASASFYIERGERITLRLSAR